MVMLCSAGALFFFFPLIFRSVLLYLFFLLRTKKIAVSCKVLIFLAFCWVANDVTKGIWFTLHVGRDWIFQKMNKKITMEGWETVWRKGYIYNGENTWVCKERKERGRRVRKEDKECREWG